MPRRSERLQRVREEAIVTAASAGEGGSSFLQKCGRENKGLQSVPSAGGSKQPKTSVASSASTASSSDAGVKKEIEQKDRPVQYRGLAGYTRPCFKYIAAPIKDKRPLGVIVQEWASKEKLKTGIRWKDIDDQQMETITTVGKANAFGVPYAYTKRIVTKISGLVAKRRARLLVKVMHGKIVSQREVRRAGGRR